MRLPSVSFSFLRGAPDTADTSESTQRRKRVTYLSAMTTLMTIAVLASDLFRGAHFQARVLALIIASTSSAVLLAISLTTMFGPSIVGIIGAVWVVCVILADWYNAAAGYGRTWSLTVLVMDVQLATGVPRRFQAVALHLTALWVVLAAVENGTRLGMYDAWLVKDAGDIARVDCADPPCATGPSSIFAGFSVPLVVLYTDFFATRHFAEGLQRGKAKAVLSVHAVDQVVGHLVHFDLFSAEKALRDTAACLDDGLVDSLHLLLKNLSSYKPYLPQSCFENMDDAVPSVSEGTTQGTLDPCQSRSSGDAAASPRTSVPSSPRVYIEPCVPNDMLPNRVRQPQRRRATLLACNCCGLLAALAQCDAEAASSWLEAEVGRFADAVQVRGGVTDLLSGDHFTASFGALRAQGTLKESAVRVAVKLSTAASGVGELGALRVTSAVCSGRALCGDFGSDAARRFMIIGGVSSFIVAMERAAAAWRAGTLLDAVVHQDTTSSWHCRLRKRVTFPKLSPKPIGLWEVTQPAEGAQHNDEWMYEMESAQKNPWEAYNNAVMSWCEEKREAALAVVEAALLLQDGAVAEALHALRKQVQEGTAAPEGPLTAGALAGDPSPLSLPE
eukprot:TRINITY_DN2866_c0_g2_i5.p1 TRINITY_DN2866_c0_g2~~TRINITY_DN2866_c0_g2_i5.p1  ORF type:complete len:616 (+),score=94.88 TRINITY_DN2866_c0_g2_i5:93-1940(+)